MHDGNHYARADDLQISTMEGGEDGTRDGDRARQCGPDDFAQPGLDSELGARGKTNEASRTQSRVASISL